MILFDNPYLAKDSEDIIDKKGDSINLYETQGLDDNTNDVASLMNILIRRELELDRVMITNSALMTNCKNEYSEKINAIEEKKKLEDDYQSLLYDYFDFINILIEKAYGQKNYFDGSIDFQFWIDLIFKLYSVGRELKFSHDDINNNANALVGIYTYYNRLGDIFDIMVSMAKKNNHYILWNQESIKWACDNYVMSILVEAIENRLKNGNIPDESRKIFIEYLDKAKKTRDFYLQDVKKINNRL